MDKWYKLLNEERRRGYQKRIKRYIKDRDALLNKGGQKNTPPYTSKMGNHVTFDKQTNNIGEEVEPESFEKQPSLDERFWKDDGDKLSPKIARRLTKISEDFMGNLEVPAVIEDIRFTGSLANYNWSKYSDVDLHIVVDFAKIDEDTELVKSFFDAARMRWNDTHNIKIHGYEVEIYVENIGDAHKSSGIYSINNQEWIVEPDPSSVDIDISLARKKSDDIETQVNLIQRIIDKEKYKISLRAIERLKLKIRRMRKAGLDSPKQEFSPENIAFKILRREEVLQKLSDMKYDAYDRLMSMPKKRGNGEIR
jgi:predicted nucleotidyltransferase